MAKTSSAFDVWLLAVDTVYKGVPFSVVLGWAEQGRLSGADKLRPAGGEDVAWVLASKHPQIAPYLYAPQPIVAGAPGLPPGPPLEPLERDDFLKSLPDDDDDVDMIPLIDISLVLLIFFMMTSAVSSMSPVSVPELRHAGKLTGGKDAWTVTADKTPNGTVYGLHGGPNRERFPNLRSLDALAGKLNAHLDVNAPAEVRVAFHKRLQRRDLKEVIRELDKLRAAGLIAVYAAEVNEEK